MTRKRTANLRSAFTLIELMVVIAIIGLLVGILLPAFGTIRTKARVTQTAALFQALDTGISMYRGEQSLGGTLPPSASDNPVDLQLIKNPKQATSGNNGQTDVRIAGAHLLVQAMIGADSLGTPGFKDFDRDGQWWNDTHDTDMPPYGAYALDVQTGKERHPRYGGGGYVDDKMKQRVKSLADLEDQGVLLNLGAAATDIARDEPLFVDPWDTPILYYKAGPGLRMTADLTASPAKPGIYRQEDNGIITGTEGGQYANDGLDFGAGKINSQYHAIYHNESPKPTDPIDMILTEPHFEFARFILDLSAKTRPTPVRKDKYLLISAGPDARYGTEDDVTNWKREVQ